MATLIKADGTRREIQPKNGEKLLGFTDNKVLLNFIAQYVKFVQIDEENTGTIPLYEIIKKQQENK